MSRVPKGPPRWAERLIRAITPVEDVDFLAADLAERYEEIEASEGRRRAYRWYRLQALRGTLAVPRAAWDSVAAGGTFADVRLAGRVLRRRPLYTAGVVGTMALGIASLVTVGSIAWAVWLAPFPFPDADRVVRLYEVDRRPQAAVSEDGPAHSRISPPLLEDLRAHDWASVRAVAGVSANVFDWARGGRTTRVRSVTVSPEAFDILGVRIVEGRGVSDDPDALEVALTEAFWSRAFGQDPDVVGREDLVLNGRPHRVVGIVRPEAPYPGAADIYTAIRWDEDQLGPDMRGARYLDVIARVDPGYTVDDAAAEMDRLVEELGTRFANHEGWGGSAAVLSHELLAPYRSVLALLLTAGLAFLLLALSNVMGLVAARSVEDGAARSVRLALGSSEGRLLRASVLEGGLVGVLAGMTAVVVSVALIVQLRGLVPAGTPRAEEIGLSVPGAIVALLVGLAGGLCVGGVGHLVARGHGAPVRASTRTATGTRGRAMAVAGQVALTTLLGIGGAVVLAEIASLRSVDLGFEPEGVGAAQVILSGERHPTPEARRAFWNELLERAAARGVDLSIATNAPMSGMSMPWGFYRDADADQTFAQYHIVSEGYFERMGIEVLEGRGFNAADRDGAEPVVIISRTLASEIFPGEEPVGRDLIVLGETKRIVGIVESVRHFGPDQDAPIELYAPFRQDPWPHAQLLAAGDPQMVGPVVDALVSELDPPLEIPTLGVYDRYVEEWFQALRLQSIVVGLLAVIGTLLTALGLYALVAYRVSARGREIGIRMALGASRGRVFSNVVRDGTMLAVFGTMLGCAVWFSVRPALAGWIDTFGGAPIWVVPLVAVLVLGVSVTASAAPAARSVKIDPSVALRRDIA